jgi:hypothetical protein
MKACDASVAGGVDLPACSVLVYGNNAIEPPLGVDSSLSFKAAVDPACTLDRVYSGLCSACTAAAATAGMCPPGTHTFVLDMGLPGGRTTDTILAMVFHVGSHLLSAEVMIQFEVISSSRDIAGAGSNTSETLQHMLVASKVRFYAGGILFHFCPLVTLLMWTLPPVLYYAFVCSEH